MVHREIDLLNVPGCLFSLTFGGDEVRFFFRSGLGSDYSRRLTGKVSRETLVHLKEFLDGYLGSTDTRDGRISDAPGPG